MTKRYRQLCALGVLAALLLASCAGQGQTRGGAGDPAGPSSTRAAGVSASPTTSAAAPASVEQSSTPTPSPARAGAPTAAATAAPSAAVAAISTATSTPAPTQAAAASPTPAAAAAPTQVIAPAGEISLPPGFGISVFAAGLEGPRMLALGPDGQLYAAERSAGRIVRLPDRDQDGVADGVEVAAEGLDAPSSLAFFQDGSLYVGLTTQVLRLSQPDAQGAFQQRDVIVDGLPEGGHSTRTVIFSPDWQWLYVSVGSSCNVCREQDQRRAAIVRYRPDGSAEQIYARGLRNAVGLTLRPGSGELWASNNGRDHLGDDLPPETINVLAEGDDFGWPRCHAGDLSDPDFGGPGACDGVKAPAVELQAHSAPLGLTFYTGQQFPEEYRNDLFVAFHGSWNRSVPTGYKVVRVPLEQDQPGTAEDFATGWLLPNGSDWGRPVDLLTAPDGSLWLSDDAGGSIYRIFYARN